MIKRTQNNISSGMFLSKFKPTIMQNNAHKLFDYDNMKTFLNDTCTEKFILKEI